MTEFRTKYAALKNILSILVGAFCVSISFFIIDFSFPTLGGFILVFLIASFIGFTLGFMIYFILPHHLKMKIWTPIISGFLVGLLVSLTTGPIFDGSLDKPTLVGFLQYNLLLSALGIIGATASWLVWKKIR